MTGTELWESVQAGQSLGQLQASMSWEEQELRLDALDNLHPWFRQCSPYGEKIMDPFVMVRLAPQLVREALPHESRAVYSRYSVELKRPVLTTSTLTVTGRIAEKYEKRGGKYIRYEIDFLSEDGEHVMRVGFHTLLNAGDVLKAKEGVAHARS